MTVPLRAARVLHEAGVAGHVRARGRGSDGEAERKSATKQNARAKRSVVLFGGLEIVAPGFCFALGGAGTCAHVAAKN